MKQCPKGHIDDEKRSAECPYCRGDGTIGFQSIGGMGGSAAPDFPRTMPVTDAAKDPTFPSTMPVDNKVSSFDMGGGNSGGVSVTVALNEDTDYLNRLIEQVISGELPYEDAKNAEKRTRSRNISAIRADSIPM